MSPSSKSPARSTVWRRGTARVSTHTPILHVPRATVNAAPHPRFRREGRDLFTEVEPTLEDAVLGGDLNVSTLKGRLALRLPPETQNGQRFRLAGQGMPALNDQNTKGDLYAIVKVKLPTDLSSEEQSLFSRLKNLRGNKGG